MNNPVPSYLLPYVLSGTLAIVFTLLWGLNRALRQAKWQDRERRQTLWRVGALLVVWCAASIALAWAGFYRGTPFGLPTIPFALLIPIAAGIVLFQQWSTLRKAIEAIPQEWMVAVQSYRVLGIIFLVLYAAGRLPGAFALPAGIGDVSVGLLAPAVGLAYTRGSQDAAKRVRSWNLLGLADLIVAVTTGFLTSPSPVQLLALDAPNQLVSAFPLALVPVFLVPIWVLLHLASLKKLGQLEEKREIRRPLLGSERS